MGPDGRLGSRSGSGRQVLPMTDRHHAPAHSVAQHLHLDIREYDRIIRTFIPGTEQPRPEKAATEAADAATPAKPDNRLPPPMSK